MPERGDASRITVEGLGKRYGGTWAVRNVDFSVEPGTIFGLIGPNGAGKTTILKILAGILEPTEGTARVGGRSVEDPAHRHRIGYLPEESALYEDMTPVSYLEFFSDLYGVRDEVADERIASALDDLDLEVRRDKRIGDLSKGMKRKVAIARSLVNDPALLIYDEPASGLDPVVSSYILDLLGELKARGKTVVLAAHNLYHMELVCDRLMILHEGRTAADGTLEEVREAVGGKRYRVVASVRVDGAEATANGYELSVADLDRVREIEERVEAEGGQIVEVETQALSLEDIFLRTQGRERR